jgi:hypothetical protein
MSNYHAQLGEHPNKKDIFYAANIVCLEIKKSWIGCLLQDQSTKHSTIGHWCFCVRPRFFWIILHHVFSSNLNTCCIIQHNMTF